GDPQRFPEQLKYVEVWRPRRLVHPSGGFGGGGRGGAPGGGGRGGNRAGAGQPTATPAPDQPPPLPKAGSADTGEFNPILGYSYEELATLSRSMHHSQGTGAVGRPGPSVSEFELVAGDPAAKDLFDRIDTTWNRLPGGSAIGPILDEAIRG